MPDNRATPYRLSSSVQPTRYEITLAPDLNAARFEGSEEITIEVRELIDSITLNAVELRIDRAWVTRGDGKRIAVSAIESDDATERATLSLAEGIGSGSYVLHLEFFGFLNDKLRGFYRSRYEDSSGVTRTLAATQFEATDARRAFPCFDEPEMKAIFSVTLVVDEGLLAVSNGSVVAESPSGGGKRRLTFADTIRMSTYLVAFVVGPLEATPLPKSGTPDGEEVPIRLVHPLGQGHLARFALEVARFCLRFFADYYGIPYPGAKLDLVAMPDFAAGAMENLGCVTFRESLLLVDSEIVTQGELKRSAEVIAHELAHMWFGDLVTMRWWNGIWLNEAFATFMANLALEAFRPAWRPWAQFSLGRSAALEVDALDSTRPIEYPVESPADAEGMFDVLTYQKGAAVLRMLQQYLGEEPFRKGVHLYLARHSYGNTETGDLWAALEEATGEPAGRVMESWIFQPGYPRVRLEVKHGERAAGARSRRSGDVASAGQSLRLELSQARFRFDRQPAEEGTRGGGRARQLWSIPLLLRIGEADGKKATSHRLLLEQGELDGEASLFRLGKALPDFIMANAEANGFYRVGYAPELLARLRARMFDVLSAVERFALLDDTWAALLSGESDALAFLSLAEAYAPEEDIEVWKALSSALAALSRLVEGRALQGLRLRVTSLVSGALARTGWDPRQEEPERLRELRGLLVETLCVVGADAQALARAREIQKRSLSGGGSVEPNLAAASVQAVASFGDSTDFERFVERSRNAPHPQERLRYLYALAAFPGAEEFDRAVAMTLSGEVRTQNAPFLLGAALRNRFHGERAWRFVRENWETINTVFPSNTIARMVGGVRSFNRPKIAAEVESFLADHPLPQGRLMITQHLELMRINVALREREAARFAAALLRP